MEKDEKQNGQNGEEKKEELDAVGKKTFKISDKRFWKKKEEGESPGEAKETEYPTYIEELKEQKEASELKLMEYINAFKKAQAEQEEFRKRLNRDIDKKIVAGKRDLFIKLLDMMDNLDRAIGSAKSCANPDGLLAGIIISRDLFLSILKKEGIERLELIGKPFDPQFAEAVMIQEVDDPAQANIILEEIQPGYAFNSQTLRPAKVKVAKLSAEG
jgi:molecular chaperone GrpE